MKFLLALVVVGVVSAGGDDWKMFMKWAKTKAMESCWGEENMKLHTLSMKKAVAKCMQTDAPEVDLPPFRAMDRLVNTMVSMAGHKEEQTDTMDMMMKMMLMMKMMHGMKGHGDHGYHNQRHGCDGYHDCKDKYGMGFMMKNSKDSMMDKMKSMMLMKMMSGDSMMEEDSSEEMFDGMDMGDMFEKMYKMKQRMSSYSRSDDEFDFKKMMGRMRFKREAEDALALNDRLKEKLETAMGEHMAKVSNMTCVLREMHVIDEDNNIDVKAMKADTENYKMPSDWFKERYFTILDSCNEVAENLPADLDNMYNVGTDDSPLRNMGKIKSFMSCCKSAKMKLCMHQDTKQKIETNFGPVDELLEGFNNQLNEEQLFYMVNQMLQGPENEFM